MTAEKYNGGLRMRFEISVVKYREFNLDHIKGKSILIALRCGAKVMYLWVHVTEVNKFVHAHVTVTCMQCYLNEV